jgi:DNA repair exonuclease SbcCD ATPase subunit
MTLKDLWARTSNWLRSHKLSRVENSQPDIDDEGLISQDAESAEPAVDEQPAQSSQVVVKTVQPKTKPEPLETLQEGFNKLIEQLHGINEHLSRQAAQHENLMSRIEQLPRLLESFPALVENQKQITEQLLEQLKAAAVKNQQFIEAVEKIPTETAKQTDALIDIDHQLAAAADSDVQMAESFNKFNQTLDKLNKSSLGQTDSITQMSKTFATSDRYLKYIISRQNKRFIWTFVAAIAVCVLVILILTGIIIYLRH